MNGETPSRLKAPELRVAHWLDGNGQPRTPLTLADLGTRYIMLYCFQHWCPGCHSTGFPTLEKVITALSTKEFGVAVVQTVFEGEEVNTPERLRETQLRYDLHVPFGHDAAVDGYPSVMHDYRTGVHRGSSSSTRRARSFTAGSALTLRPSLPPSSMRAHPRIDVHCTLLRQRIHLKKCWIQVMTVRYRKDGD